MSNLDNLLTRIINDCKAEAAQIIDGANKQAAETTARFDTEAAKERELILADAKLEASRAAERISLAKRLEVRDNSLKAKREAIDTVFQKALEELNAMPDNNYWTYLTKNLLEIDAEDGTLIIPDKYKIDAEKINSFLLEKNKPAGVRIYAGKRTIDGGFVLIKDGVEYNRTFEALISYRRTELESDIVKALF